MPVNTELIRVSLGVVMSVIRRTSWLVLDVVKRSWNCLYPHSALIDLRRRDERAHCNSLHTGSVSIPLLDFTTHLNRSTVKKTH